MRVHAYERAFLVVSGMLMLAAMAALVYSTVAMDIHLPGHDERVNPATLHQTPPFDQPGVRQTGPNEYEVVIVGRTWFFQPNEIRVPVGAEVTFVGTAGDVIHGIHIERTRVNVMLIPGQVARVTYRFREPGEYLMMCHEYCGLLHHAMAGKVIVE
jgi:cytochrome c oxidase subunit II